MEINILSQCFQTLFILNIKNLMRSGVSDLEIKKHLLHAFSNRPKDGFEAEQNRRQHSVLESMSTIGG